MTATVPVAERPRSATERPRSATVLIFTCQLDGAPPTTASVRWRALYPAAHWPEADVYPRLRQPIDAYESFIFQKAYLSRQSQDLIKRLRAADNAPASAEPKILAFDLCDADWTLSAEHEDRLNQILPYFDFAVATTEPIAGWLGAWIPTYVIPDRVDLDSWEYAHQRGDDEPATPSLVWYGYSRNAGAIEATWPVIEKYGLDLTLVADEMPQVWAERGARFVRWTYRGAPAEIARHDVALCPPASKFKSMNRVLTAWAHGLASASTPQELEALMDRAVRQQSRRMGRQVLELRYAVQESVAQWRELFARFITRREDRGKSAVRFAE